MMGSWDSSDDILKEMLYWQKRALEAEKMLKAEREFTDAIIEMYEDEVDPGEVDDEDIFRYRS